MGFERGAAGARQRAPVQHARRFPKQAAHKHQQQNHNQGREVKIANRRQHAPHAAIDRLGEPRQKIFQRIDKVIVRIDDAKRHQPGHDRAEHNHINIERDEIADEREERKHGGRRASGRKKAGARGVF